MMMNTTYIVIGFFLVAAIVISVILICSKKKPAPKMSRTPMARPPMVKPSGFKVHDSVPSKESFLPTHPNVPLVEAAMIPYLKDYAISLGIGDDPQLLFKLNKVVQNVVQYFGPTQAHKIFVEDIPSLSDADKLWFSQMVMKELQQIKN